MWLAEPVALTAIAATVTGRHKVKILDMRLEREEVLANTLVQWRPDLVGATSMTTDVYQARAVLRMARQIVPGALTVVGGHAATLQPEEFQEPYVDVVVQGELELLLLRAPDSEARLWLSRVLVDEYGEGSEGKDHPTLYAGFLDAAGGDSAGEARRRLRPPAQAFIETHHQLVRKGTFLEGLGAVGPGHEWSIPEMFEAIIPGLRRAGFTEQEIAYFTLHIEQDDDHGSWLEEALVRYCQTPSAQREVRRGALRSLEARRQFWDGVQRAVIRFRQPRATRPDGAKPRSTLHEVVLTMWDGWSVGRRIDTLRQAQADSTRPTLDAMLQRCRQLG